MCRNNNVIIWQKGTFMRAYIFDFNGTMVMDSFMHEKAWRHYVEKLCHREVTEDEFVKHVHGKTSAKILEHFLGVEALSKEEVVAYSEEKEAYYRELCMEYRERFHLTEGLAEFLNRAKAEKIPMTIATAANLANVEFYFDYFDLEQWFDKDKVVYDDTTLKGKPDPDIYIRAMQKLSVSPKDCVVFEDAVSGVKSAYAAGAGKIVGVYGDSSRAMLEETGIVDLFVKDFTELEGLV